MLLVGVDATRNTLPKFRIISSEQVHNNLSVAIKTDDHGDPIAVIIKRLALGSSTWFISSDVEIRFASKEITKLVSTNTEITLEAKTHAMTI